MTSPVHLPGYEVAGAMGVLDEPAFVKLAQLAHLDSYGGSVSTLRAKC